MDKLKLQIKILQLQLEILLLRRKKTIPNLNDPKYIILHHGGGSLNFEQVNLYHKGKWGFMSSLSEDGLEDINGATIIKKPHSYIGYQYFIEKNGTIYQGRSDNEEGAHTLGGFNRCSIAICLQGDFNVEHPTVQQLSSLQKLVDFKKKMYNINIVYRHKDLANTSCPGDNFIK